MLTSGGEQRINRNFVDAIAANMLLKRIDSYEKAVQYIRNQAKVRKEKSSGAAPQAAPGRSRAYGRTGTVKPDIPIVESSANGDAVTEEEFAELLKMAEQMQASKQNKASK